MDYEAKLHDMRQHLLRFAKDCANEAEQNEKEPRRSQNEKNWNYFYGKVDWSHKRPEDPKIHLHKIGIAVERTRAKLKQNLMNYDKWLAVEREYDNPEAVLTEFAAKNLVTSQFEKSDAKAAISDAACRGLLESRMAVGIFGQYVTRPRYTAKQGKLTKEEKLEWQLHLPVIGFEDLLLDTFDYAAPLFQIYKTDLDFYRVLALSDEEPSANKPYLKSQVEKLGQRPITQQLDAERGAKGRREQMDWMKSRRVVTLFHFFGTVLNDDGTIMDWELADGSKQPLKDVYFVIGNDAEVIRDPERIRRWSGRAPFVYTDLLRAPGQGRKAIMDAGVDLNQANNELFNLMLTGALKGVHNVTWVREQWIKNKEVLSGGIKDGETVLINDNCPPGATPMGTLRTGEVPQESYMMQNVIERALAENVLSNQLDLTGSMPSKQVRATELVQASTAISDIFDSIAGDIEDTFIEWLAQETLYEIVQHIDEMDKDYVRSCFGYDRSKAEEFLAMSPKERFAQVDGAFRFRGKGLRGLVANAAKAQALINYMNTLAANPAMMGIIETHVSIPKVAQLIAKGLGLDKEEIAPDEEERAMIEQKQLIREQALAQAELMGQATGSGGAPGTPGTGSMSATPQPGGGQEGL